MAKRKWYVEVCKIEAVNRLLDRGEHYGRPTLRDCVWPRSSRPPSPHSPGSGRTRGASKLSYPSRAVRLRGESQQTKLSTCAQTRRLARLHTLQ